MTTHRDTTMLAATDPAFWELYPFGATVRDATDRHLIGVMACNPITGEVVMADCRPSPFDRILFRFRQPRYRWWNWLLYSHFVQRRHGFWPAPLTITPIEPEEQP